jgi:hypothetical protein
MALRRAAGSPRRGPSTRPAPAPRRRPARGAVAAALPQVTVTNIIPRSLSAETNQDSEPHLSINPADPKQIVATAFTPDPTGGNRAPIFVSTDGGANWALNSIVPSAPGGATGDITTAFSGSGPRLHAGILRVPSGNLENLWSPAFSASTTMNIVLSQPDADQPFTVAAMRTVPVPAREQIYVGVNDFSVLNGRTASIQRSLGGGPAPAYTPVRLERRVTSGQDGPQIRPAVHADGTVYAAFYRWRTTAGNPSAGTFVVTSADVIVARDDNWGQGPNAFSVLTDPTDGLAGRRVAQGVTFQWMASGTAATGQQRLGGCLSMAVNPNNSSQAYLVYADRPAGSIHTLHLQRTDDRGQTWSPDLLTVNDATNGAVAVNADGTIGILYQQLDRAAGNQRWKTIFAFSANGAAWTNIVLADVPATRPLKVFDPYLGDYDHLLADGTAFIGIFSAGNIPDMANYPSGVIFHRNADFNNRRLLRLDNVTAVQPSIDPYFFRVGT